MEKILVVNGPNFNISGIEESEIHGLKTYEDLCREIEECTSKINTEVDIFQPNHEGEIVDIIQEPYGRYYGIVVNPGAHTHTSIAILDALKVVGIRTTEVHLADVTGREDYRKKSFISGHAEMAIYGKGFEGYLQAIEFLIEKQKRDDGMQYIPKGKKDFKVYVEYLKKEDILFQDYDIKDYHIINVFDNTLCSKTGSEEEAPLDTKDISIENGYSVTEGYKKRTVINVRGIEIGGEEPVVTSGPCSIGSEEVVRNIAIGIKKAGADILGGGIFKPRTSPYEFQGSGRKGIDILSKIDKGLEVPVVTEVADIRELNYIIDKADILQVGARNMYDYSLLRELGKLDRPVLLKRRLSATIRELLLGIGYVVSGDNRKVILCERGIRTYENYIRNTVDIATISFLKNIIYLPIIVNSSHATGRGELINSLSRASILTGADGIIIESYLSPENAWSDGEQTVDISSLKAIVRFCK